jgi:hypothetical protein
MRDTYHDFPGSVSSEFAARTKAAGAVEGEPVDLQGYEAAMVFCVSGALGAEVNTYEFELKEVDELAGPFSPVDDDDLLGSEPSFVQDGVSIDESDTVKSFGYVGSKRYVRVDLKAPVGAGTGGGILGAIVVKGRPRHAPAIN